MIVHVSDSSQVADARRAATQVAESLRFSETAAGKAALLATELATNLVKHGEGGSILFVTNDALTMIAIDKGRGIPNVDMAMRDGFSTAGSPGTGLGAIARTADAFDVYSIAGQGTAVLCKVFEEKKSTLTPSTIHVAGVCIAKPGEEVSGDSWTSIVTRDTATIGVVDGLGHGEFAFSASSAAIRVIRENAEATLERMLADAHGALRVTRGAAVGLARIHLTQGRLEFAGVGNIAGGAVADDTTRRVVSLPGIVGHEMRKVTSFSYPWAGSTVLILHSDGISANWNAGNYPGLLQRDPALIAAVIYRDYCRGTDDATVVVAKAV